MRCAAIAAAIGLALSLVGCAGSGNAPSSVDSKSQSASQELASPELAQQPDSTAFVQADDEKAATEMKLNIDGTDVDVVWEDNQAVVDLKALAAAGPLTVGLSMYGGFEQVGPLGSSLAASDEQMTTEPGDIVLYAVDQISIFYGSNSWAYTRLGHIADKTSKEMAALLGDGDVSVTITVY